MNILGQVALLVVLAEGFTEGIAAPIKVKFPQLDTWWLVYISWIVGGVLVFVANLNLLAEAVPSLPPLVGQVATALIAGRGANYLHEVFSGKIAANIIARLKPGL